jgi:hypothetical protein
MVTGRVLKKVEVMVVNLAAVISTIVMKTKKGEKKMTDKDIKSAAAFLAKFKAEASRIDVDPSKVKLGKPKPNYVTILQETKLRKSKIIGYYYNDKRYGYTFHFHNSHPLGRLRIPLNGSSFNDFLIKNMIRSAILDTP